MKPSQRPSERPLAPSGSTPSPPSGARPARHELSVAVCFEARDESTEDLRDSVLACRRLARDALRAVLDPIVRLGGHDPALCCRPELTGRVADLPLFDLMQMVAMGRRSAVIDVRDGAIGGRIWCAEGEIIDASSGGLDGAPAAHRILALEDGDLCADFRPVARARRIREGMQALVMDAARRKDESAELKRGLGDAELVWWAANSVSPANPASPASPANKPDDAEAALLALVASGARLDRILAQSTLGDLETLRTFTQLFQRGAVRPRPSSADPVPAPGSPRSRGAGAGQVGPAPMGVSAVGVPSAAGASRPSPITRSRVLPQPASIPPAPRWFASATRWVARRPAIAGALVALGTALTLIGVEATRSDREPAAPARVIDPPPPSPAEPAPPASPSPAEPAPPASPSDARLEHELAATPRAVERRVYPLRITAEPADASLWLDGDRVGTGELSMALPRDGRTHELRIDAPGHRSQTVLFQDLSPPRTVTLERLGDDAAPEERETPAPETPRPRSSWRAGSRARSMAAVHPSFGTE